jgi:hypothetical protein
MIEPLKYNLIPKPGALCSRPAGAATCRRPAAAALLPHRRSAPAARRPRFPAPLLHPSVPRAAFADASSDGEPDPINPALESMDFTDIKVLDPVKIYDWLVQYQPFSSLSPEAVREIAEVRSACLQQYIAAGALPSRYTQG